MTALIVGLLLAAGTGRRYDPTGQRLKLLEPLAHSPEYSVAEVAARSLRSVCEVLVAVVQAPHASPQQQLHALLRQAGCTLTINDNPERGMGLSLAVGVRHIEHVAPHASGCVVALADMPFIAPATVAQVVEALERGHQSVAPTFNQRRGHPVGFASALFGTLAQLNSDEGARSVLQQHPPHLIAVSDPGIERDIDFPEENLP